MKNGYRLIHIWQDDWKNNKVNIKQKLIDIFLNKENLNFSQKIISLDRSWYNNIIIQNYQLISEQSPQLIKRNKFLVENCGKLIFKKIK